MGGSSMWEWVNQAACDMNQIESDLKDMNSDLLV